MRLNPRPFPDFIDECYRTFWNLPDIDTPPPRAAETGCEHLCLIPLFTDAYRRVENLAAFIRAAIHSRDSCLRNTDATEQGVVVKLYIEDILYETFEQTLRHNYIDPDEDVLWFHAPPLELTADGIYGHLGKQMWAYWDERLVGYERVTVWDADMFFLAACKEHGLFARFGQLPAEEIGYLCAYPVPWQQLWRHWNLHLIADTKLGGVSRKDLLAMAAVPKFEGDVFFPMGCFWTYPAKHFHGHRPDFVAWMRAYAPYFGNDQIIAACWNVKFGIPLFPLDMYLQVGSTSFLPSSKEMHIFHGAVETADESAFHMLLSRRGV